jgi:hypothetical protein
LGFAGLQGRYDRSSAIFQRQHMYRVNVLAIHIALIVARDLPRGSVARQIIERTRSGEGRPLFNQLNGLNRFFDSPNKRSGSGKGCCGQGLSMTNRTPLTSFKAISWMNFFPFNYTIVGSLNNHIRCMHARQPLPAPTVTCIQNAESTFTACFVLLSFFLVLPIDSSPQWCI